MALVAQETQLFATTVRENIAYGASTRSVSIQSLAFRRFAFVAGLDDYREEDLIEAAKMANCYDFITEMEDGFETKVGERGVRLSGQFAPLSACSDLTG